MNTTCDGGRGGGGEQVDTKTQTMATSEYGWLSPHLHIAVESNHKIS